MAVTEADVGFSGLVGGFGCSKAPTTPTPALVGIVSPIYSKPLLFFFTIGNSTGDGSNNTIKMSLTNRI